jgi:hypothetical protein
LVNICRLSFTNHFAKSITVPDDDIVVHVYPNSLINRRPSGTISSDNRRCTAFCSNDSSIQSLHRYMLYTHTDRNLEMLVGQKK